MLVLTRKVNEQVVIRNDVRITVVSIRGNQVRIGIEAPKSISIFRGELKHDCRLSEFTVEAVRESIPPPTPCSQISTGGPRVDFA